MHIFSESTASVIISFICVSISCCSASQVEIISYQTTVDSVPSHLTLKTTRCGSWNSSVLKVTAPYSFRFVQLGPNQSLFHPYCEKN